MSSTKIFLNFFILFMYFCANSAIKRDDSQNEFIDPCSRVKCSSDELCIAKNDLDAYCVKQNAVGMHQISKREIPTFCGTSECRHGECEVLNSTSFVCHCTKGVTGENCNRLDTTGLPCSSNPCHGGSVCISLPNSYVCVCGPGRTGSECKHHTSPCQCQNGGVCLAGPNGMFSCKCPNGYGGYLCQFAVKPFLSCEITGCLNQGICTVYSKCFCPPGFTGLRCESLITTKKSTTTTTTKAPDYNINVCYVGICQNGGTCIQLGQNFGICLCTANFTGPYCSIRTKAISRKFTILTTQKTKSMSLSILPNTESCPSSIPSPCQNKGLCLYSKETNKISCSCPPTYTGAFCEQRVPFCADSPCKNGGTCNQIDLYNGKCTCPSNYGGFRCDITLSCDPNPCLNNQPCLVVGGVARCFCAAKYKQPYCE